MHISFALAASAALFAVAAPASAGSVTGQLPVSATVLDSCTIVAVPILFGPVADVGAENTDSLGTITLTCTPNAAYTVAQDGGLYASSGQRRMRHNTDTNSFLPYEIYRDSARQQPWSNTTGNMVTGNAALAAAVLTAYARIPKGATSGVAGNYADSVTITVTF